MFSDVQPVVTWLFSEVSALAVFVWNHGRWVGVCVIGLPLIVKVINIFKKLL